MNDSIFGLPVAKIGGFPYGEWTTEPPTQEGWYWVMDGEVRIGEVFFASKDTLMVDFTDEEMPRVISAFTHWLGPLPVPDAPEDKHQNKIEEIRRKHYPTSEEIWKDNPAV